MQMSNGGGAGDIPPNTNAIDKATENGHHMNNPQQQFYHYGGGADMVNGGH